MLNSWVCARPVHVGKSGPLALLQVLQNSGSQMHIFRFSSEIATCKYCPVLHLNTYQQISDVLACIGMYCGMYRRYILNAYQHVSILTGMYSIHTSLYWHVLCRYYMGVFYIDRLNTYHNTCHNTCQNREETYWYVLQSIQIYTSMYWHVFGWYLV